MTIEMQNQELIKEYQATQDQSVIGQIYNLNRGLLYKICTRVSFMSEIEDLLQECYFAVKTAVETYKDEAGEFGKYLTVITSRHVLRYARGDSSVTIPDYMQDKIYKYLSLQTGDHITDRQLCRTLGVTLEELEQIKRAVAASRNITSLDVPISEDDSESDSYYELVADQEAEFEDAVIDRVYQEELSTVVQEELSKLPEKDRLIISLRFFENYSYKDICPEVSSERTRQKVQKICMKLRKNKRLEAFYEETNVLIGSGLNYWKHNHTSAVERAVLKKCKLEEMLKNED